MIYIMDRKHLFLKHIFYMDYDQHLKGQYVRKHNLISEVINSFPTIMISYLVSLFSMAYLFSVYENHSYLDGLYWSACTSLTIGYGDLSPHTDLIKVLTILLAHFWAFIVIPAVIIKFFMIFIEDRDAFTHEEQENIKCQLERIENLIRKDTP